MYLRVTDQQGEPLHSLSHVSDYEIGEYGELHIEVKPPHNAPKALIIINPRLWGEIEIRDANPWESEPLSPDVPAPTMAPDPRPTLPIRIPGLSFRNPEIQRAMEIHCSCDQLRCPKKIDGFQCHHGAGHEGPCLTGSYAVDRLWPWGRHNHHPQCARHPDRYNRPLSPAPLPVTPRWFTEVPITPPAEDVLR